MKHVAFAVALALATIQDGTKADERTDLEKLQAGRCLWGTPASPVDLQGKVVLWRTWSG